MLNLTQINAIYPNGLPDDLNKALQFLTDRLTEQKEHVKSATVLSNCSIDYDRTLHLKNTFSDKIEYVLQGVIVQVAEDYTLGYKDAVWFHPELAKGRSVIKLDSAVTPDDIKSVKELTQDDSVSLEEKFIGSFNNSIGEYSNITIDDMGLTSVQSHLVINTSMEPLTYPLWSKYLISGETMGTVYRNWNSMDMGQGKSISDMAVSVRSMLAAQLLNKSLTEIKHNEIYRDEYNSLYSDGHYIFFANHGIKNPKTEDASVLIELSALSGFELYKCSGEERFIPCNLGVSNNVFNWKDMSTQQRQRIFHDCSWEGSEGFNTYVLRQVNMDKTQKKHLEQMHHLYNPSRMTMRTAKFSSQPIRNFMEPEHLLNLTPATQHMDNIKNMRHVRSGDHIEIPIQMGYHTFSHLVQNFESIQEKHPEFQLFNTSIINNGYIKIPRDVMSTLIE
jgi:hypothetical protein